MSSWSLCSERPNPASQAPQAGSIPTTMPKATHGFRFYSFLPSKLSMCHTEFAGQASLLPTRSSLHLAPCTLSSLSAPLLLLVCMFSVSVPKAQQPPIVECCFVVYSPRRPWMLSSTNGSAKPRMSNCSSSFPPLTWNFNPGKHTARLVSKNSVSQSYVNGSSFQRDVLNRAANADSNAVSARFIPMILLLTLKQSTTAAVTTGAVKQPGNSWILLPAHISELYSIFLVRTFLFGCMPARHALQLHTKWSVSGQTFGHPCTCSDHVPLPCIMIMYRL